MKSQDSMVNTVISGSTVRQKEPIRGQSRLLWGIVGGVEDLRTHSQF